ncbi:MAG: hypothetical protein RI934_1113 [Bacteroidota bacterium]
MFGCYTKETFGCKSVYNMNSKGLKQTAILFIVLFVPVIGYFLLKTGTNHYKALPIYGEKQTTQVTINGKSRVDTIYHEVGSFSFQNQHNETVNDSVLAGKIKIVNFFFTTCQTICPKMATQMERVQKKVQTIDEITLLSYTVNPEKDDVNALANYAKAHNAIKGKWNMLTGPKKDIYELARRSYLVTALEGDGGPDDFIHTEMFVLVDPKNKIRGFYDGTSEKAVDSLIDDIKVLVKEEISPKQKK